mmetsp:Transcript_91208/g.175603  ORF Transcript_91208/g.175603 Transcript_91208/m.175603 type:complete len:242 (+) Transcript_91208:867-1592(+)
MKRSCTSLLTGAAFISTEPALFAPRLAFMVCPWRSRNARLNASKLLGYRDLWLFSSLASRSANNSDAKGWASSSAAGMRAFSSLSFVQRALRRHRFARLHVCQRSPWLGKGSVSSMSLSKQVRGDADASFVWAGALPFFSCRVSETKQECQAWVARKAATWHSSFVTGLDPVRHSKKEETLRKSSPQFCADGLTLPRRASWSCEQARDNAVVGLEFEKCFWPTGCGTALCSFCAPGSIKDP